MFEQSMVCATQTGRMLATGNPEAAGNMVLTRQIRQAAKLVDIGNPDHGNDRGDRGKREQAEGLELGLSLHLRVPQDHTGNNDQSQICYDRADRGAVPNDDECLDWCAFCFGCRVPYSAHRSAIQQRSDEGDGEGRPRDEQECVHGKTHVHLLGRNAHDGDAD